MAYILFGYFAILYPKSVHVMPRQYPNNIFHILAHSAQSKKWTQEPSEAIAILLLEKQS